MMREHGVAENQQPHSNITPEPFIQAKHVKDGSSALSGVAVCRADFFMPERGSFLPPLPYIRRTPMSKTLKKLVFATERAGVDACYAMAVRLDPKSRIAHLTDRW